MKLSDAFPKEVFEPSGDQPALGPRNKGWKTVKKEIVKDPSGVAIEKTWRVRSFGIMKNAFLKELKHKKHGIPARMRMRISAMLRRVR